MPDLRTRNRAADEQRAEDELLARLDECPAGVTVRRTEHSWPVYWGGTEQAAARRLANRGLVTIGATADHGFWLVRRKKEG